MRKFFLDDHKTYLELKIIVSIEDQLNLNNPNGSNYISRLFSCPIGVDTIFISVDGFFHACCKADYSMPFGHIDTGLDKEKLKKLYISYFNQIDKQCKNCWAFRFCPICPALTSNEGTFKLPTQEECKDIRKIALLRLMQYIVFMQEYNHLYSRIIIFSETDFRPELESKPLNLKENLL